MLEHIASLDAKGSDLLCVYGNLFKVAVVAEAQEKRTVEDVETCFPGTGGATPYIIGIHLFLVEQSFFDFLATSRRSFLFAQ